MVGLRNRSSQSHGIGSARTTTGMLHCRLERLEGSGRSGQWLGGRQHFACRFWSGQLQECKAVLVIRVNSINCKALLAAN
jgi:hypothetical protein